MLAARMQFKNVIETQQKKSIVEPTNHCQQIKHWKISSADLVKMKLATTGYAWEQDKMIS